MDQHIFFALSNTVATQPAAPALYPIFTAKDVADLNTALQSPSIPGGIVARKKSRSYIRCYIFFSITLAAYVAIAIVNDVEVDSDLAMTALIILLTITHTRMWRLRRTLGKPGTRAPFH
jgi:hypothetical protein